MAERLPSFQFERGLQLVVPAPAYLQSVTQVREYLMIGRLEDGTPLYLQYLHGGITYWACATRLSPGLRKKILSCLREDVRRADAPPSYLTILDFIANPELGDPVKVREDFHRDVWRAEYLNDRDEDYVDLKVPYAEKDAAEALGAQWDGARRVWKVKRQSDMSAFANWLAPAA